MEEVKTAPVWQEDVELLVSEKINRHGGKTSCA